MRKGIMYLLTLTLIIFMAGCSTVNKSEVSNTPSSKIDEQEILKSPMGSQKIYKIPSERQKEDYSVEEFKDFYREYLKLNNLTSVTSPEDDKTGMQEEDKKKYYTIYDITPEEVKKEIGCQIFKVNYSCETYVVYKSRVFQIGFGFGGWGIVSLVTGDFDGNGQKELIYTFSWGSGLHRSQLGVYNFSKGEEQWLDFQQMNKELMLEKVSDYDIKVYSAEISQMDKLNYCNFKLSKDVIVGDIQRTDGKMNFTDYNKKDSI